MDIKTYVGYEDALNRIKTANKEDKELAVQLVNSLSAKNITSCNAKIILGLCHDLIDINSKFQPIR